MSISQTIHRTAEMLSRSDTPLLDAKVLMAFALGLDQAGLILEGKRDLTPEEQRIFAQCVGQRLEGKPVSQIIGEKEFWSLTFKVTTETLTPRPDSEALIEAALSTGITLNRILDVGTGTGCLLASLLTEFPAATGVASDISPGVLEVAQENFTRLGLETRAQIKLADGADGLAPGFDLIVCNPPYVPFADRAGLAIDVRDYEPSLALFAEANGLSFYQRFAPELLSLLNPKGVLLFEVGHDQAEDVGEMLAAAVTKPYKSLAHQDLAGRDRVVGLALQ